MKTLIRTLSVGSSPLARGLHQGQLIEPVQARIIPARAGFTWPSCSTFQAPRDHPRSRGVYSMKTLIRTLSVGSSPLARGLHQGQLIEPVQARIIPARAGFTESTRRSWGCARDHPRSRGVYTTMRSRFSLFTGSSPLARGLLREAPSPSRRRWIIPARAGFTRARVVDSA